VLQVLPKGTEAAEDTKALDSAFAAGDTVVVDGDDVQLQQLSFDIPAGSDLTGGAGTAGDSRAQSTLLTEPHNRQLGIGRSGILQCMA
jgi:hypothetical protein